jgi:hypothetical protein
MWGLAGDKPLQNCPLCEHFVSLKRLMFTAAQRRSPKIHRLLMQFVRFCGTIRSEINTN